MRLALTSIQRVWKACPRVSGAHHRCYVAFGLSGLLHLMAMIVLALIGLAVNTPENPGLHVDWSLVDAPTPPLDHGMLDALRLPIDSGARCVGPREQAATQDQELIVPLPAEACEPSLESLLQVPATRALLTFVGSTRAGGGPARDEGQGKGVGAGIGALGQPGFFGVQPPGEKFVYVVDCSNSMNAPHSEAVSRFQRLKLELVRSIGGLAPNMQFYVIFFSSEAHPMPADALQYATYDNKRTYLDWVGKMRPGGGTDPELSLKLALFLRPDVIYLLTDGSFDKRIGKRVLKMNPQRVAIHTFGFGNEASEDILRGIAEENRGLYQFVP